MKYQGVVYKSFCWCLGTTSFRTKSFNRKIEEQLLLLKRFFDISENQGKEWRNNSSLQKRYYQYMLERGFVTGEAVREDKDAREKTSGLADIGLIDDNRRITPVGEALLNVCQSGCFDTDNFLQIPKDSFIYLKQLLKTSINVDGDIVRPLIVLLYFLSHLGEVTLEEFTYLLPLCTNVENTEYIYKQIGLIRDGKQTIDEVIVEVLLSKPNYQKALSLFLQNEATEELVCVVGMNRKSRKYDLPYWALFKTLYKVYMQHEEEEVERLLKVVGQINIGKWWRQYLFKSVRKQDFRENPIAQMKENLFSECRDDKEFKRAFFTVMHMLKAKATLSDYYDLNKRYVKITDILVFEEEVVRLDLIPKYYFNSVIGPLYKEAFIKCEKLHDDCLMQEISSVLQYNEAQILASVKEDFGEEMTTIEEANKVVEREKYERFGKMIDVKFSKENLLILLESFDKRDDELICKMVTDNADVPTIFEYILGVIWYKLSKQEGKILDYLKLSLDSDLLPVTHAAGGEADIVYEYENTSKYPKHALLLEATLSDSTNQRRMEMEPVSRHLGNHLLSTRVLESYCVFVTNKLNVNVISDFRIRKNIVYYNTQDPDDYVRGMKIIPLEVSDLRQIIIDDKDYSELYGYFDVAFKAEEEHPKLWYEKYVKLG